MSVTIRLACLAFLGSTVLACGPGAGGSNASHHGPESSPEQILQGARRALGGDDAIQQVRAMRFQANASGPGGDYGVTVHSSVEGAVRLEFSTGFTAAAYGGDGWLIVGTDGTEEMLSDTMETFVRGHDLLMNALHPEQAAGPLRFVGEELFNELAAIRLDGVDGLGAPISFYYAQADTLPLGFRLVDHVRGAGPVTTSLYAWQPNGGLLLPTRARFVQGSEVFEYEIAEIETHETVDRSVFTGTG